VPLISIGYELQERLRLPLPEVNVFPPHLHAATGMNLQPDHAFRKCWFRILKIGNLNAVKIGGNPLAGDASLRKRRWASTGGRGFCRISNCHLIESFIFERFKEAPLCSGKMETAYESLLRLADVRIR
jgi:hypothetical protein